MKYNRDQWISSFCACSQTAASFRLPVHRRLVCGFLGRHVRVGLRSRRVPVGVRSTKSDPVIGCDACTHPGTRLSHVNLGGTTDQIGRLCFARLGRLQDLLRDSQRELLSVYHCVQPGRNDVHHPGLASKHVLLCREDIRQEQRRECAVGRGQQDDPIVTLACLSRIRIREAPQAFGELQFAQVCLPQRQSRGRKAKRARRPVLSSALAEREGFEPSVRGYRTPDFESGTFDHSATSPMDSFGGSLSPSRRF